MTDAFDTMFGSGKVRTSVRRTLADGSKRGANLTEGIIPKSLTLADVAEAAMSGVRLTRSGTDRGANLAQSRDATGAAARSAVLAMGDELPADTVPPAVARRGKPVAPSVNGTPNTEPAAS